MIRIVFSLIFLIFNFAGQPVSANDLYTVENVLVRSAQANSAKARDEAFAQSQVEAFKILAHRLRQSSIQPPEPRILSGLVRDFEIKDEKLSSLSYQANFTVRFKPDAIDRFFGGTLPAESINTTAYEERPSYEINEQYSLPSQSAGIPNKNQAQIKSTGGVTQITLQLIPIQELEKFRIMLQKMPNISMMKIVSLRKDQADFDITYQDLNRFFQDIAANGYKAEQQENGQILIRKW